MDSAELTLAIVAGLLALAFWLALVFLIAGSRRANHWLTRFGLMAVTLNFALLWTYSCLARVYDLPDRLQVTAQWSRIASGMLAAYMLGFAVLTWWVVRKVKRQHG